MLAERYQYIDPQISDCLKSPLGSTDYNLAVSAVRKFERPEVCEQLEDTIHLAQSKSHCKLRK